MPIEVRLEVESDPPREYQFDRTSIVLGCHPFNDLVVTNQGLAARHGRFVLKASSLQYQDLGGRLGSRVARGTQSECLNTETREIAPGDVILLGARDQIRITVLAFGNAIGDGAIENIAMPTATTASEVLDSLDPEQRKLLVDCGLQILSSGRLTGITRDLQRLIDAVVPNSKIEVVIPQGDYRFHDTIVVCDAKNCQPELAAPDSQPFLKALSRDEGLKLAQHGGRWELSVPVLDESTDRSLVAYLRIAVAERPAAQRVTTLAKFGYWLRPILASIVRSDSLAQDVSLLLSENRYFRTFARRHYLFKELVSLSPAMQDLYRRLNEQLETEAPAVVVGEAGCGKKLVGRAMHHLGPRKSGMFVTQHCGELSEEDLDIELFGVAQHSGGQFYRGLFELANGGTLFLDEIDRMPLTVQTKLVRVLREREVRRAGDETGRTIDVRVVAGTHRDLSKQCRTGHFRNDLFKAFGAVLEVPPLRDRQEDLLPLSEHFVRKYNRRYGLGVAGIGESASRRLLAHSWLGNVRELQIVIETAVIKAREGYIEGTHLDLVPAPPVSD